MYLHNHYNEDHIQCVHPQGEIHVIILKKLPIMYMYPLPASYSVKIVFNVHNQVKLKILTVNPYINS